MIKRLISYFKFYNEPDYKLVKDLAVKSSSNHFRNVFCPSIDEQLAYQRAYIIQFRHNYAKIKLKEQE
jgi:hypothetical protein